MPLKINAENSMSSFLSKLAVLIPVLLLSCGADRQEPVKIGATMSMSGAFSTQGTAAANGYRLCEEHLNENEGLLGRPVEFIIRDDESDSERAVSLYRNLIEGENVDLILGPYGSTLTEAVAPVTEEHQMVHITPLAATTSIWEQGREYLFMVLPPAELFLSGQVEIAQSRGIQRIAVLEEQALFPEAAGLGAASLAVEKGMQLVFHESFPSGTTDFSEWLEKIRAGDVQALTMAASDLSSFITITQQMKQQDVNLKLFGTSGAVSQFQEALGLDADYVYGLSAWEPSLPYDGIEGFTSAYRERFGINPSFHAAGGYGGCQLLAEAVTLAGNLDQQAIREVLLELETQTIFSNFAVDERGYQIANQGVTIQWQNGEKVVVWPEELATGEIWFPAPEWQQRNNN
jgi:branched-chain amino acid transport system substrate-binding protein